MDEQINSFRQAIESHGLQPGDNIVPGRFHRFPGAKKSGGNRAGWAKLFDDGRGGVFGDHSTGLSECWQLTSDNEWTPAEQESFRRQVADAKRQGERERKERQQRAADEATLKYDAAQPATNDHPYLKAKNVKAHGLRLDGESLVVPLWDGEGALSSLQFIDKDGGKRFMPGGGKKACYFTIGGKPEEVLLIAEGYATAATLHEATGYTVAVAFDAGNLKAVGEVLRLNFPNIGLIFCADDDHMSNGNPGKTKAYEAALALGGVVAMPCFGWNRSDHMTDFNDLACHRGLHVVEDCVMIARNKILLSSVDRAWFAKSLANASVSRFLDHDPPELDWVFVGSLLAGTTGTLVGPGAVGKSTLALILLMSIATGRTILPGIFTPSRAGKVLGVFAEDDEPILHHRLKGLVDAIFPFDANAINLLKENMKIMTAVGKDLRLIELDRAAMNQTPLFRDVLDAVKNEPDLRLIVIDPLSRFYGGDENDNGAGTFFVSLLEQISLTTHAAVISSHHVSKAGRDFDLYSAMHQDASRGASAITNGVRWQCNLAGLPEKEAKKELRVKFAKPGQYLAMTVSKKNYGPPEPVHFLERLSGGVLRPYIVTACINEPDLDATIRELLLAVIRKADHCGEQLTQKLICDGKTGEWKKSDSRITKAAVVGTIAAGLLGEIIFERQGKNKSGKGITYLSLVPQSDTEAEPAIQPLEPAGEPAAFEPAEPAGTGQKKLPVHNLLNLLDSGEPAELNRQNDLCRFVTNCSSVVLEPAKSHPYGGGKSPAGSHRGAIPQCPVGEEKIEYEAFDL